MCSCPFGNPVPCSELGGIYITLSYVCGTACCSATVWQRLTTCHRVYSPCQIVSLFQVFFFFLFFLVFRSLHFYGFYDSSSKYFLAGFFSASSSSRGSKKEEEEEGQAGRSLELRSEPLFQFGSQVTNQPCGAGRYNALKLEAINYPECTHKMQTQRRYHMI